MRSFPVSFAMRQINHGLFLYPLYYFLIKNFNYPISASNAGNDIVRQRANGITQAINYLFKSRKDFIAESTLSDLFPNLFNGIHFRRIWRDVETDNVLR